MLSQAQPIHIMSHYLVHNQKANQDQGGETPTCSALVLHYKKQKKFCPSHEHPGKGPERGILKDDKCKHGTLK
jgi:hypothetical protein